MAVFYSLPAAVRAEATPTPKTPARPEPDPQPWALLDIEAPSDFKPSSGRASLPGNLSGVPAALLAELAVKYNASEHAKQKRRWAVVTANGCLLMLTNIAEADRPSDPTAFPPGARIVVDFMAEEAATAENMRRYDLARVPRHWTVALRPLTYLSPREQREQAA